MVRKGNLEDLVLLASLVPMELMDSLTRRVTRVHQAPLDHKVRVIMQ